MHVEGANQHADQVHGSPDRAEGRDGGKVPG